MTLTGKDFYQLICYMAASARGLTEEPAAYGPFRLVDSISRLIDILADKGLAEPSLLAVRELIEEEKYSVMEDWEGFVSFLDRLVMELAQAGSQEA